MSGGERGAGWCGLGWGWLVVKVDVSKIPLQINTQWLCLDIYGNFIHTYQV